MINRKLPNYQEMPVIANTLSFEIFGFFADDILQIQVNHLLCNPSKFLVDLKLLIADCPRFEPIIPLNISMKVLKTNSLQRITNIKLIYKS